MQKTRKTSLKLLDGLIVVFPKLIFIEEGFKTMASLTKKLIKGHFIRKIQEDQDMIN